MKPMLATDADLSRLVFPLGVQPKIDGVRGLTSEGYLTGRSLKKFKNKYTTEFFSQKEYLNLDGELTAAKKTEPNLCRITTSAVNTIEEDPFLLWYVFDYLGKNVVGAPYKDRYDYLSTFVMTEQMAGRCMRLRLMPMQIVNSLEEAIEWEEIWLNEGYEGIIYRGLGALHKEGRSSVLRGGLLRNKRFMDAEMVVTGITEAQANGNEMQTNELGLSFRSSHMEHKFGNGMVGSIQGTALQDILDPQSGEVLIKKGQALTIGPGNMNHEQRTHYYDNQEELIGNIAKFKFFPKGHKDLPRFPVFLSFRIKEDMSE